MIEYISFLEGIQPRDLSGFFEGWPHPPTPETHLRLLQNSDLALLAIDQETGAVVGFITALTDGVLCAYIPLLEVLPAWRGRGIGQELVRQMQTRLEGLYMIDLLCDPPLQSFYRPLGFHPATGMLIRDYAAQSGRQPSTDEA